MHGGAIHNRLDIFSAGITCMRYMVSTEAYASLKKDLHSHER